LRATLSISVVLNVATTGRHNTIPGSPAESGRPRETRRTAGLLFAETGKLTEKSIRAAKAAANLAT